MHGCIFDVDGVLLDTLGVWKHLGSDYLRSYGVLPRQDTDTVLFSMSLEEGADYFKKSFSLPKTSKEIQQELWASITVFYQRKAEPKKGARSLLAYLQKKKIPVAAATSSAYNLVTAALYRNGLHRYISKVFTVSQVGESKHNPLIYKQAACFLGTAKEQTYVFEDSLYALKTARQAGFFTVGVFDACGEQCQQELAKTAHIYVKDLNEFSLKYCEDLQ